MLVVKAKKFNFLNTNDTQPSVIGKKNFVSEIEMSPPFNIDTIRKILGKG